MNHATLIQRSQVRFTEGRHAMRNTSIHPAADAVVELPGVPPSPNQLRGHWASVYRTQSRWKHLTRALAHTARVRAGWQLPSKADPPEMRRLEFTLYRHRLLDTDNGWASIKICVDGLKDVLIANDDPGSVQLLPLPPPSGQVQIPRSEPERLVLKVSRCNLAPPSRHIEAAVLGLSDRPTFQEVPKRRQRRSA